MSQLKTSQAERVNSPSFSLVVLFRPSMDRIRPTHIKGEQSALLSPQTPMLSSSQSLSQSPPSRHLQKWCLTKYLGTPIAQVRWHSKLIIRLREVIGVQSQVSQVRALRTWPPNFQSPVLALCTLTPSDQCREKTYISYILIIKILMHLIHSSLCVFK